MNGEAKKVIVANELSTNLVRTLTPLPKDLHELLLTFVGVFQNYNKLRHVFSGVVGHLDCKAGKRKQIFMNLFPN